MASRTSIGWLGVAATVTAIDVALVTGGHPSLSQGYLGALGGRNRLAVILGTAYLVCHLAGVWPGQVDPLGRLGRLLSPNPERAARIDVAVT